MKIDNFFKKILFLATFCLFFAAVPTKAQVITVLDGQPYTEDFEGNGFSQWTVDSTNGGHWSVFVGGQTTVCAFSAQSIGDEARLISPVLDMSNVSEATLAFAYAMMGLYDADILEVCYRTSATDNWHALDTFSFSDYSNYYESTSNLPNLSSTYQISFLGRFMGGFMIFIDDIEVASSLSCARPINLEASDITESSALLNWSTTGNEVSWTLELNGVDTTVTNQPCLIRDLTPSTTYSFKVKANCGDGDESQWSLPIEFTTLCDVIIVTDNNPYIDDFEASEEFECWQNEIISGTDSWVVDPGYLIPNNSAFFIWLGEQARLYTTPLDISAVTEPTLAFKHKQPEGYTDVDEISVWYRSNAEESWQLLRDFIFPTDGWENESIPLPNPSERYQVAFVGISHNAEGVYVDDVKVGAHSVVGIEERPTVTATASPNPTTGRVRVETSMTEGTVTVLDMCGRQVATSMLVDGHADIDLTSYAPGMYLARISSTSGTTTIKVVKE